MILLWVAWAGNVAYGLRWTFPISSTCTISEGLSRFSEEGGDATEKEPSGGDEDDSGAGGRVGPVLSGDQEAGDGGEEADEGSPPEHTADGSGEVSGRGGGDDEEGGDEENPHGPDGKDHDEG